LVKRYDALGRLIHSEQRNNDVTDAATVNDYLYDHAAFVVPQVNPTNMLGRLTEASSPTGAVSFSYDAFGRGNARMFLDDHGGLYVEKHAFHGDGSPSALDLLLPDTGYADEHVDYAYDSAGRPRSVTYANGASHQDLFAASNIDPFGRVRQAQYGVTSFTANYADAGRNLLSQIAVSSPLGSRSVSYPSYDPVGRERSRNEVKDGTGTSTSFGYDALGRLSSSIQTRGATTVFNQQFTYDALGNILALSNTAGGSGATSTTLSYLDTDRDRICRIAYGADGDTACNVTYDQIGNIIQQPTRTGTRQLTYFADGNVRSITDGTTVAQFRYDALGEVQQLDLTSDTSPDTRHDRRYGELLEWRDERTGASTTSVLSRKIPGPGGLVASRRGPGGSWVFAFGEARGNRFFTDETGAFVQDVDYLPYGEPRSSGAPPGSSLYSKDQWNGGDSLAALGVSHLGARIYDPAIGRFLSRDPLLIPRTAATTNPYAFAVNDPINGSDPSGLDCIGVECSGGPGGPCVFCDLDPGGRGHSLGHIFRDIGNGLSDIGGAAWDFFSGLGGGSAPGPLSNAPAFALMRVTEPATASSGLIEDIARAGTCEGCVDSNGDTIGFPDEMLNIAYSNPGLASQLTGPAFVSGAAPVVALSGAALFGALSTGTLVTAAGGSGTIIATHPEEIEEGLATFENALAGAGGNWPTIGEKAGGAIAQLSGMSCGAACGEMVAGIPQAQLISEAGAPTGVRGLAMALGQGWSGSAVTPESLSLLLRRAPFIAQMHDIGAKISHFVVVDGMHAGQVLIRDPADGGSTYRMALDEFIKFWNLYSVWR
jgi:RHS repeat-associated protein